MDSSGNSTKPTAAQIVARQRQRLLDKGHTEEQIDAERAQTKAKARAYQLTRAAAARARKA